MARWLPGCGSPLLDALFTFSPYASCNPTYTKATPAPHERALWLETTFDLTVKHTVEKKVKVGKVQKNGANDAQAVKPAAELYKTVTVSEPLLQNVDLMLRLTVRRDVSGRRNGCGGDGQAAPCNEFNTSSRFCPAANRPTLGADLATVRI